MNDVMPQASQRISIVFVEEQTLYRESLTCLFDSLPDLELLASTTSGIELINLMLNQPADIGILDLHLTDIHAFELIRRVRSAGIQTRLIVLASRADLRTAAEAIRGGAQGMVLKSAGCVQLVRACQHVMGGGIYIDPQIKLTQTLKNVDCNDPIDPLDTLNSREHQVFSLLIEGLRAKEIAARLAVSPKTVDTYRASVMRKLKIQTGAGLVKYAVQRQLTTTNIAVMGASR